MAQSGPFFWILTRTDANRPRGALGGSRATPLDMNDDGKHRGSNPPDFSSSGLHRATKRGFGQAAFSRYKPATNAGKIRTEPVPDHAPDTGRPSGFGRRLSALWFGPGPSYGPPSSIRAQLEAVPFITRPEPRAARSIAMTETRSFDLFPTRPRQGTPRR